MCDPVTMIVLAGMGGMAAGKAMSKQPSMPAVQPPAAAPKAPNKAAAASYRKTNAMNGGAGAGASSTLLTGPSGANPLSANVGQTTLLGR